MNFAIPFAILGLALTAPALHAQTPAPAPAPAQEKEKEPAKDNEPAAPAEEAPADKAAAHYRKLLTGTWKFEIKQEGMQGSRLTTFREDGTCTSKGEIQVGGKETPVSAESKWTIKGNKLSFEVTKTSDAALMSTGQKWTVTIVRITEKEFHYLDDEDKEQVEKRVPDDKKQEPK